MFFRKQHPSTLWQSRTRSPAPTGPGAHTPRHRPRRPLLKAPAALSRPLSFPIGCPSPPAPNHLLIRRTLPPLLPSSPSLCSPIGHRRLSPPPSSLSHWLPAARLRSAARRRRRLLAAGAAMSRRRGGPLGYALLCGQAALLLANLLLLRGASRAAPHNASEPDPTGQDPPANAWAYSDPQAPLVLCTYL